MEGAGSWEALEWTKIEHVSRSISHGMEEFLLEAEDVVAQGHGVVLVNTDEAGILSVTNFRLLFVSEVPRRIISLGTIPLATIEKFGKQVPKYPSAHRQSDRSPRRLLQVIGKDMRIIVFGFRPRTKQRRVVFEALWRCTRPAQLWDLYTFTCGPSKFKNTNPRLRLLNEYFRLLGSTSIQASTSMMEDEAFSTSNKWWRISTVNSRYTMCPTYPFALIVPEHISDEEIRLASSFRARSRLPVISWCNPETGAVIARSSQPLVGLVVNTRSNADEKLVAALCTLVSGDTKPRRKLYIADARPRKNALANSAMGGGSESSSNYFQSEVVFFGIDNIHAMRDSLSRLRDYLDKHGTSSSDGMSSFLRNGGWTWGGGNLSSMSVSVANLEDSGWLSHVQSVLAGSAWIAARVDLESASVLVHCSDGWDRTTQLVSLASLLLDPYYRTFKGFQALVEKDWLAFGHPFSDRMGLPNSPGNSITPTELYRQSSGVTIAASPMRIPAGSSFTSSAGGSHMQTSNNISPIFLQWADCVSQLLRMYPCAFEFSATFLVDFLDCMLSCRFGNFLCNSEKERQQSGVSDTCGCMWMYLANLRAAEDDLHEHCNPFYDPDKHGRSLLPPAAALAPTLWPQFHLRWSCPSEAHAGELEAQVRILNKRRADIIKARNIAETKVNDLRSSMESLTAELQKERHRSNSAMIMARRACRESLAMKRAVQSLGCRVQFSSTGNTVDTEKLTETRQRSGKSYIGDSDGEGQQSEREDFAVSISAIEDGFVADSPPSEVCEALCPFRTRDGCKWPDASCAQLGSQFIGLKANFDAFDRLTIYDCYFGSE
uniref:Myotubularin-related protein 2 n=1 Tax=Anthurium amnicola TaxID=1678845 RepID=A0A1D1YSY4_9ARAE